MSVPHASTSLLSTPGAQRDINKARARELYRILSKQCGMNGAVACTPCCGFLAAVQKWTFEGVLQETLYQECLTFCTQPKAHGTMVGRLLSSGIFPLLHLPTPSRRKHCSSTLFSAQHCFCLFWSHGILTATNKVQSHRRRLSAEHKCALLNVFQSDTAMLTTAISCFGNVSDLIKWRPLLCSDSLKGWCLCQKHAPSSLGLSLSLLLLPLMFFHLHTVRLFFSGWKRVLQAACLECRKVVFPTAEAHRTVCAHAKAQENNTIEPGKWAVLAK